MRYETKFRIEGLSPKMVESCVLMHPAGFTRAYPKRTVHNIYLDNIDRSFFFQNNAGANIRSKVRVRWYTTDGRNSTARLEIKDKHNFLGKKRATLLDQWQVGELGTLKTHLAEINPLLADLSMVFYSHYERDYYESFERRFRITIDSDLRFYPIDPFEEGIRPATHDHAVILELKYDKSVPDEEIDFITQHLPFAVTKNSKYAHGVMLTQNL